jgi:hypothetical protein
MRSELSALDIERLAPPFPQKCPRSLRLPAHPGGMLDNSPAFQRWGGVGEMTVSLEGTAELIAKKRAHSNS